MTDPLRPCLMKIERAQEHFVATKKMVSDFLDTQPYLLERRDLIQTGETGFPEGHLIFYGRYLADPPPDLALAVGDCIHNLRSSLDYLIWSLVQNFSGADAPNSDTGFPVRWTPDSFAAASSRMLKGTPPGTAGLIQAMQPYRLGEADFEGLFVSLGPLHSLDVEDKHHTIVLVGSVLDTLALRQFSTDAEVYLNQTKKGRFRDGEEVGRMSWRGVTENARVDARPDFSFDIAFDLEGPGPKGEPVVKTLRECFITVRAVVAKLAPLFS